MRGYPHSKRFSKDKRGNVLNHSLERTEFDETHRSCGCLNRLRLNKHFVQIIEGFLITILARTWLLTKCSGELDKARNEPEISCELDSSIETRKQ